MRKTLTNSANIGGLQNEDIFATLSQMLKRKGYLVATQKIIEAKEAPIFSTGNRLRLDFYFEGKPAAPLGMAVSAKYQEVDGTADKAVYYEVVHVIKRCMPVPCVLLVRGDHWLSKGRAEARGWLLEQKDSRHLREVFFSVDDFYKWAGSLPDCTGVNFNNGQPNLQLPFTPMEQRELF